jgi:hypothetical protein
MLAFKNNLLSLETYLVLRCALFTYLANMSSKQCFGHLITKTIIKWPKGTFPFQPNVSYVRVFGSKCYILVKKGRRSKFAPKAVEGFLLGYDSNTKAYRVFNKSLGLVEVLKGK